MNRSRERDISWTFVVLALAGVALAGWQIAVMVNHVAAVLRASPMGI